MTAETINHSIRYEYRTSLLAMSIKDANWAPRLTVDVAIATLDRGAVLIETIDQLLKQPTRPDAIIVVDQSESHPPAVEKRLNEFTQSNLIRLVRLRCPNLPAARNVALRMSKSDVVIFIDDDVVLAEDFVGSHVRTYESSPKVCAVAGHVTQRLGWSFTLAAGAFAPLLDYSKLPLMHKEEIDYVGNMIGCNHSVRRESALAIGGYDEGYAGMALREDTDFALRLVRAGCTIRYVPTAALHHLSAPSAGCRRRNAADISGAICILRFSFRFRRLLGWAICREIWRALRLSLLSKQVLKNPRLFPEIAANLFRALREIAVLDVVVPPTRDDPSYRLIVPRVPCRT